MVLQRGTQHGGCILSTVISYHSRNNSDVKNATKLYFEENTTFFLLYNLITFEQLRKLPLSQTTNTAALNTHYLWKPSKLCALKIHVPSCLQVCSEMLCLQKKKARQNYRPTNHHSPNHHSHSHSPLRLHRPKDLQDV